jgi:AraC-like DNA-binding protein
MSLSQYVNRLRINLASQTLMNEASTSITDICFASGFTNLSNFNRQFLRQKGMSPSRFRRLLAENAGRHDDAGNAAEQRAPATTARPADRPRRPARQLAMASP